MPRCVCTIFDNTSLAEWGHLTASRTERWARRHGYHLTIRPYCEGSVGTWCIPRRVLEVLEDSSCAEVCHMQASVTQAVLTHSSHS